MPPATSSTSFVTLARLLRPQGRRGELLAELLTGFPELLSNASGVYVVSPGKSSPAPDAQRTLVESKWMPTGKNAGRIVVKLAGCDSISAAEALAQNQLMLPADERPELGEDTYYISDLVECLLYDASSGTEKLAGEVVDVEFATSPDGRTRLEDAAPLLVVQPEGTEDEDAQVLVPFVLAHLVSVKTDEHRIVMNIPEGLF